MRDLDHLNDKQEAIKHLIQAMRNVAILTLVGLTIVLATTLLWLLPYRFVVFWPLASGFSFYGPSTKRHTWTAKCFRGGKRKGKPCMSQTTSILP
jgi:hypothetical protein